MKKNFKIVKIHVKRKKSDGSLTEVKRKSGSGLAEVWRKSGHLLPERHKSARNQTSARLPLEFRQINFFTRGGITFWMECFLWQTTINALLIKRNFMYLLFCNAFVNEEQCIMRHNPAFVKNKALGVISFESVSFSNEKMLTDYYELLFVYNKKRISLYR